MNKLYKLSASYAIIALVGGVFYREFTKFNGFTGTTTLSFVHTHAFMLGMFFFLLLMVLEKLFQLSAHPQYKKFLVFYNSGVLLTIIMLITRGIPQVLNTTLSSGMNAAISGISGIGHILLCIGLIFFFLILKKQTKQQGHIS